MNLSRPAPQSAPRHTLPRATVVVPTRDRSELLRLTVRSLLAQRGVEVDVVVVDDGSREPAARAVRGLGDERIEVVSNPVSRGVAAARNQGASVAGTPWVAFCDDDDLWAPNKLAGQIAAAGAAGRRWAYTGAVKFAEGPTIWQVMPPPRTEEVRARLADKNIIPAGASNVVVHRDIFLEVGGFDEGLRHLADWDLWLRLLETGCPARADGLGVAYRLHTGAMSLHPAGILEELAVLDIRWRQLRGGRTLDPAPTHLWIAMSWLRAGRRLPAARSYLRAMGSQPRHASRGLLRTLHPQRPQPAHVVGQADQRTSRFKRVEVVEVGDEMLELLNTLGRPGGTRGFPDRPAAHPVE